MCLKAQKTLRIDPGLEVAGMVWRGLPSSQNQEVGMGLRPFLQSGISSRPPWAPRLTCPQGCRRSQDRSRHAGVSQSSRRPGRGEGEMVRHTGVTLLIRAEGQTGGHNWASDGHFWNLMFEHERIFRVLVLRKLGIPVYLHY